MIDTEKLRMDLIIAKLDYQDNKGSEHAGCFYSDYLHAYRAYWSVVDPSVLSRMK